jgi:DNA-binding winged helix-turn-helix (wHTH) protein/tetratricopeptide (TPR) repeat protein
MAGSKLVEPLPEFLRIGDWYIQPRMGSIERGGEKINVRPRAMEVLVYLAHRPGVVVSNDELIEQLWAPAVVGDDAVMVVISELRKALGDDSKHPAYVARIPKRGYQLIAAVEANTPGLPNADFEQSSAGLHIETRSPAPSTLHTSTVVVLPLENLADVPKDSNENTSDDFKELEQPSTPDQIAAQHYHQGRLFLNTGDSQSRPKAIVEYTKAIEINPDYVAAHCGLALACLIRHLGANDPRSQLETFTDAAKAGQIAYELDPNSAMSIGVMGCLYFYDWQWDKASEFLQRSLKLDPNNVEICQTYASLMNHQGRGAEAAKFMEETLSKEPLSPIAVHSTARLLRYLGRYSDATAICERALEASPNSLVAITSLTEIALASGDLDSADKKIAREIEHAGEDNPTIVWHQMRVYGGRSDTQNYRRSFNKLKLIARNAYVNPTMIAFGYFFMQDLDRFMECLERGVAEKDQWLIDLGSLPLPKAVRSTDRLQSILQAVKHSQPRVP